MGAKTVQTSTYAYATHTLFPLRLRALLRVLQESLGGDGVALSSGSGGCAYGRTVHVCAIKVGRVRLGMHVGGRVRLGSHVGCDRGALCGTDNTTASVASLVLPSGTHGRMSSIIMMMLSSMHGMRAGPGWIRPATPPQSAFSGCATS